MSTHRKLLGVGVAAAAGVVSTLVAEPALAYDEHRDERVEQFTYFHELEQREVTCAIEIQSLISQGGASGTTLASIEGDPACLEPANLAFAGSSYIATDGSRELAQSFGNGGRAQLFVSGVEWPYQSRSLRTEHSIWFAGCDCFTPTYVTSPK